jgi:hypothetical protein
MTLAAAAYIDKTNQAFIRMQWSAARLHQPSKTWTPVNLTTTNDRAKKCNSNNFILSQASPLTRMAKSNILFFLKYSGV